MRFVTTRELRLRPGEVWKAVEKEREVVVTAKGKPVALITAVGEADLEEEVDSIRAARALKALDRIQAKSARRGTDKLSEAEIGREVAAARRGRRR